MDIEEELKKFPFLKVNNGSWYDCVPSGWKDLFLVFCKQAVVILNKYDILDEFYIFDVKEKYGELVISHNSGISDLIKFTSEIEKASRYICIKCGKKADWITKGYVSPYCDECKNMLSSNTYLTFEKIKD